MGDERWGHGLCLTIIGPTAQEAVSQHCQAQLAPSMHPKDTDLVSEPLRTHSGKINSQRVPRFLGVQT